MPSPSPKWARTRLKERLAAADEAQKRRLREHEALQDEFVRLRTELTEERTKLDRDFVKWGDRTISLDRARGALDAMLTRAQGVFGKRGRDD